MDSSFGSKSWGMNQVFFPSRSGLVVSIADASMSVIVAEVKSPSLRRIAWSYGRFGNWRPVGFESNASRFFGLVSIHAQVFIRQSRCGL